MNDVEKYIYDSDESIQDILFYFHNYFQKKGLTPKYRFKLPFYYGKTWICYLNPKKKSGVELVFVRAREFSDEAGLLSANGRKMAKGLIMYSLEDVPHEALDLLVDKAILLDKEVPYTFKKKNRP